MGRVFDANFSTDRGNAVESDSAHSMPVEAHISKDLLNIFLG